MGYKAICSVQLLMLQCAKCCCRFSIIFVEMDSFVQAAFVCAPFTHSIMPFELSNIVLCALFTRTRTHTHIQGSAHTHFEKRKNGFVSKRVINLAMWRRFKSKNKPFTVCLSVLNIESEGFSMWLKFSEMFIFPNRLNGVLQRLWAWHQPCMPMLKHFIWITMKQCVYTNHDCHFGTINSIRNLIHLEQNHKAKTYYEGHAMHVWNYW